MERGKFLYAIIENESREVYSLIGIDGAPLEVIPYRDIAAIVSPIELKRFEERGEDGLKADLVEYQQVNLRLMEGHTVVPMRFGFTAKDYEQVAEVLEKAYLQLKSFLIRFRGRVELVVQALWDLPNLLKELGEEEEVLRAKEEGQVLEVGRILFERAEARKKELTQTIHDTLSPLATDFSEGPIKEESMILNHSYLVDRDREHLFDQAVNHLANRYEGRLTFRYIGPIPPYSFANIELTRGNFEVIDEARRTLGLPERASLEQVNRAFRRLALTLHPDRCPQDPQAGERFKAINRAYEMLRIYCHSYRQFKGGRGPAEYPFSREEVERVFIVKDKGYA